MAQVLEGADRPSAQETGQSPSTGISLVRGCSRHESTLCCDDVVACYQRAFATQGLSLDHSRIIRRGLLPRGPSSSNVRAVELRCGSAWHSLTGKALGKRAGASIRVARAGAGTPVCAFRAYSSIGQSPRLITGLFLVRTQVGPLCSLVVGAPTHDPFVVGAPTHDLPYEGGEESLDTTALSPAAAAPRATAPAVPSVSQGGLRSSGR